MYEVEALNLLSETLDSKFEQLAKEVRAISMNASLNCEICGGSHQAFECPILVQDTMTEQAYAINKYSIGNSYSDTYYPSWHNYPSFSWSNQPSSSSQNFTQNFHPPDFQQRFFYPSPDENQLLLLEPPDKSNLEIMIENLMLEQQKQSEQFEQLISELGQLRAHNKMLEHQIAQQATSSQWTYDRLLSEPEIYPKEEVQAISLMSGRQVEEENEQKSDSSKEQKQASEAQSESIGNKEQNEEEKPYIPPPPLQPPPPFPQRFQKQKQDHQFKRIIVGEATEEFDVFQISKQRSEVDEGLRVDAVAELLKNGISETHSEDCIKAHLLSTATTKEEKQNFDVYKAVKNSSTFQIDFSLQIDCSDDVAGKHSEEVLKTDSKER